MNTNHPDHPYIVSMRSRILDQRDQLDECESILVHLFERDVPDFDATEPTRYWAQYASWYADRLAESEEYWNYPAQVTAENADSRRRRIVAEAQV